MGLSNGMKITVGADPEVFVKKDGVFVNAHGLVPGTKEHPYKVNGGAVQVDGTALEFNIDPASDLVGFQHNLEVVKDQLLSMVGGYELMDAASVTFEEEFLLTCPKKSLELGCDPDFNAYTNSPNPSPNGDNMMRTAGGHVHVGADEFKGDPNSSEQLFMSSRLARLLDEKLGVFSVLWDKDDTRRGMYGQAGAFRPKSYGMEYRTLSNAWIFNKDLISFVYGCVEEAAEAMFDRSWVANELYRNIINTSDRGNEFFSNNKKANLVREMVAQ